MIRLSVNNHEEPVDLPPELLGYFPTIKNMIDDVGGHMSYVIPLYNVDDRYMVEWIIQFYQYYDWLEEVVTGNTVKTLPEEWWYSVLDESFNELYKKIVFLNYMDSRILMVLIARVIALKLHSYPTNATNYPQLVTQIHQMLENIGLPVDVIVLIEKQLPPVTVDPIILLKESVVILTNDGLYGWGDNSNKLLIDSETTSFDRPIKIASHENGLIIGCGVEGSWEKSIITTRGISYSSFNQPIEALPIGTIPHRISYPPPSTGYSGLIMMVVTNTGLYGYGNERYLGVGKPVKDDAISYRPLKITIPGDPVVLSAKCSARNGFVLTEDGLYGWGVPSLMGIDSDSDEYDYNMTKITLPGNPEIVSMTGMEETTLLLTKNNDLYVFGREYGASFGLGNRNTGLRIPIKKATRVTIEGNPIIKSIHCSHSANYVVCSDGSVYYSGLFLYQSFPLQYPSVTTFTKMKNLPGPVHTIKSNTHCAMIITIDGAIYMMGSNGSNRNGALGLGLKPMAIVPEWTMIPTLNMKGAVDKVLKNANKKPRYKSMYQCRFCGNDDVDTLFKEDCDQYPTRFLFCNTRCQSKFNCFI